MAYAALVSLSQTIHKLLHDDQHRYPISPDEKQQIMSIEKHVMFLETFFDNFPKKGNSLEGRIRDVANEAEDIIEYFMWKQIHQRRNNTSKSTFRPESSEVSDLGGMCFDLKNLAKVIQEIESIVGAVMEIKNSAGSTDDGPCIATSSSSSSSSSVIAAATNKDPIVGLEDDLMEIKSRLCGESNQLQVIPIYGMGGIGKTTLARYAYHDQLAVMHFDIRAWVTVSQDYSAPRILSSLCVSVGAHPSKKNDESEMADNIYKRLKGRRYLIVMDDMWSREAWDNVRRILPDDHNGSRVLLTTRLLDVAAYPNSSSPLHEMRFMDLEQSWNLLRKKVFPRENCPPELEDIGKTIARSCRGLPLAIVVIGGILSTVSQTPASWVNIAQNVSEVVTTSDEQFAEIVLSLSYNHLPHHLRPCFLYMGGFPEDYEIYVSQLLKLWVAEGFLKLPNGSKIYEEVAEEYLEDLVNRSLVLVMKRKSNGKIKSCNIHDLVRDLCIRKALQEKFLLRVVDDSEVVQERIRNQRRIVSEKDSHLKILGKINSTIRSITCFWRWPNLKLEFSLKDFRLLRVYERVKYKVVTGLAAVILKPPSLLSDEVTELFHLRYLSIDFPKDITAAISKLENLQTLIVDPRKSRRRYQPDALFFPLEIWRMRQLRHLVSFKYYRLPDPAEGEMFALENLQTLSVANFVCSERTVKMIPNLKKLVTYYLLESYDQNYDYHIENLVHLHHLEKLKLEVHDSFPFREKLINPVFPGMLKKLTLVHWRLPWKDIGVVIGSLPNLEVLKLRNFTCVGDKWETSEGEFRQLKFLLICCTDLQQWITESAHFPRLERLVLLNCWRLNEIPDDIGEISTLELIEIEGRYESLWNSAKRIEEEQKSWGNDALQIRLRE